MCIGTAFHLHPRIGRRAEIKLQIVWLIMKNKIYFRIGFDHNWILGQKNSRPMPVDKVVSELKKRYGLTDLRTGVTQCEAIVTCDKDADALKAELYEVMNAVFGTGDTGYCKVECRVEDDPGNAEDASAGSSTAPGEKAAADKAPRTEEPEERPEPPKYSGIFSRKQDTPAKNRSVDEVMEEINALVGANEFKMLADECVRIAPVLKETGTLDSFTDRAYLISINDGCGLSTYLNLFKELIEGLDIIDFGQRSEVIEKKLYNLSGDKDKNNGILQFFGNVSSPKFICLDISENMSQLNTPEFREILKMAGKAAGNRIIFFRIPFVEQSIVSDISKALNDMIFIKNISIPPFDFTELKKTAGNILASKDFTMDEEAWNIFQARVAAEKSDGRFYGIETVQKIIRELLYTKQLYNIDNNITDKHIKGNEISGLVDDAYLNTKSGFEQLEELIGMESIIQQVKQVVAQIEASLQNQSLEAPCIHMTFLGNPGTGKTTVARILGQIMKEKGILRNGAFFEYAGRDLCGRYVGHTAPRTSAICRDAYGSVLFIDEAYSLYRGDADTNDYGREALDTLVAEMENHRSDLMVIMAGYPKEMEKMITGNPGLKSRLPYSIEFPNYSREQLGQIFMSMAKTGFDYDQDFEDAVKLYFDTLSDDIINAKEFSNGRFVRNLYERTWGKAALRCQLDSIPCKKLTVEDFKLAAGDKDFTQKLDSKKRTIGFK